MDIKETTDPHEFLDRTYSFFLKDEDKYNLMFGTSQEMANSSHIGHSTTFWTLYSGQSIIGCAIKADQLPILISDLNGAEIQFLCRYLYEKKYTITGTVASNIVAQNFSQEWCRLHFFESFVKMKHRIYKLQQIRYPQVKEGYLKLCTEKDLELLGQWGQQFYIESKLIKYEQYGPDVLNSRNLLRIQNKELYFWIHNNRPVSLAGFAGPTPQGIRINFIFTPPTERNKGHATMLLTKISELAIKTMKKRFCISYSNQDNSISNHLYLKVGYTPINNGLHIGFQSST